jgi:hypothetical protein
MIGFKKFVELSEGGNAVPGVTGINQENSMATVDEILKKYLPLLKISKNDVATLGSTGKKAPGARSGDIDLAISAPSLLKSNQINSLEEILEKIADASKKLGLDYKIMKGLGIVSVAFPIVNKDGKQAGEKVQLDFMIVDNVKYAAWSYFSPSYLQSELKGLYRNLLNFATAKHAGFNITKLDPETKKPIEWDRFVMSMGRGLFKGKQTNLSAKTGKPSKTTRYLEKNLVTDDPDEIVKFLYGPSYKASDILTFEQAFKAIMSPNFPHKAQRKEILEMASKSIQDLGYPIPESLAKEL